MVRESSVGLLQQKLGGLSPDRLELGDDLGKAAAIGHQLLVYAGLPLVKSAGDGFARVVASPLPVRAVGPRRVGMTVATRGLTVGVAAYHGALLDEAELEDLAGELALSALEGPELNRR